MNIRRATWLAPVWAAISMAACTPPAAPAVNASSQPTQTVVASVEAQPAVASPAPGPDSDSAAGGIPSDLLNAILADASQRTGLAVDALVVIQAEATTWNDGAMGCPQPGMFYTQALVDGYQIAIDAAGQLLDYRAGDQRYFRLCTTAQPGGAAIP